MQNLMEQDVIGMVSQFAGILLVVTLLCVVAVLPLARLKRRSVAKWMFWVMFFPPIILILMCLPPDDR